MYTLLSEFNNMNIYKKNYFFFTNSCFPTLLKFMLNIKLNKFRLSVVKRMFLTVELLTGFKPLIKKIYFKRISRKKMQLRLIISKNISFSYIFNFMNFLFFFLIKFLPTTTKFYTNQSYFKKDYSYVNNFFYNFNLSNVFNFFLLNLFPVKYIYLRNYKFKLSFYFFNRMGNIKSDLFFDLLLPIKTFQKSWLKKFNEKT